jgi:hypothetical protein
VSLYGLNKGKQKESGVISGKKLWKKRKVIFDTYEVWL